MPLINCKIKSKLRWANHFVFAFAENNNGENNNADSNNIVFTIKDTKLYNPVVTLPAKGNQKLSKLLSKWFERSVYWNEH